MQKVIKIICIFIIGFVILYAFSSSYSYDNIENLAYVIAIGIDSGDNNKIKVSFQFTDTSAFSSDGNSNEDSTIINTVEAKSIESATNLLNSYIGKNINLAHCKVIVFSEDVAKAGLSNYIYSLINDSQIRPTSNIVISKCDAKYYIENSVSKSEKIITKYYNVFPNSSDYTGYIADVTLGEFFNQIQDKTSNPIAILGGKNKSDSNNSSSSQEGEKESNEENDASDIDTNSNNSIVNFDDFSITANQSSIVGERGTENIGLAVFKDDRFVGELTALEALCHSIVSNKVDTFLVSIPSPINNESNIDISVNQYKKTKVNVDTSTASPYITLDVYLFVKVLSIDENTNYLDENYLESIQNATTDYMSSKIQDYLYKTSKEYQSCIDEFDNYAVKNFFTNFDWEAYDWNSSFTNSVFDINIHTKVNSSLLLTES